MRIAIVVPVYNGADVLPRFLSSLQETAHNADLIAIDNASSDDSVALIEKHLPSAIIVRNKTNRGFAPACNQGIRLAIHRGADAVMLANQDVSFTHGWLDPLISALAADTSIGAVQPLIMLYPETELVNSCGNALHYLGFGFTRGYRSSIGDATCPAAVTPVAYCSGAALMLSVPALKKVGLLDESYFMYHEESDLCWRMRIAGYRPSIVPQSIVHHAYVFAGNTGKKFVLIEQNRILNLLKNYQLKTLFLVMPLFVIWELGLLLYSLLALLNGAKTISFSDKMRVATYFFRPSVWQAVREWRKSIEKLRIVSDREIVRLFTDTIEFQDVRNPLLEKIANPLTRAYWKVVRPLI